MGTIVACSLIIRVPTSKNMRGLSLWGEAHVSPPPPVVLWGGLTCLGE